jgi:transcriptional regulator with XRE-family HTH domain
LATYLRDLRGERYSLRDIERLTEGVVSNVYLSQLETGKRMEPNPRILVALAKAYEVPVDTLFEKAGYVDAPPASEVDVAFQQVLADPHFKFGTRVRGQLDESAKRVIIELYEKATRKKLL